MSVFKDVLSCLMIFSLSDVSLSGRGQWIWVYLSEVPVPGQVPACFDHKPEGICVVRVVLQTLQIHMPALWKLIWK